MYVKDQLRSKFLNLRTYLILKLMYPKIGYCVCEKQFHSSNRGVRYDDLFASCFSGTQQEDSALEIKYYQCSSQIENKYRFCNFDVFQVTGNIVITGHFSGLICLWNQDEGDMIDACENAHSNRVSEIGMTIHCNQDCRQALGMTGSGFPPYILTDSNLTILAISQVQL